MHVLFSIVKQKLNQNHPTSQSCQSEFYHTKLWTVQDPFFSSSFLFHLQMRFPSLQSPICLRQMCTRVPTCTAKHRSDSGQNAPPFWPPLVLSDLQRTPLGIQEYAKSTGSEFYFHSSYRARLERECFFHLPNILPFQLLHTPDRQYARAWFDLSLRYSTPLHESKDFPVSTASQRLGLSGEGRPPWGGTFPN